LLSEFKNKVAEAKERLAARAPASMPILTGPSPPASTSPGKGPRTPPVNNEECEEEEEEEEEEDDEDDYETYDEDYPESVVTETRGTVFARKDGDPLGPWLGLGVGLVKVRFTKLIELRFILKINCRCRLCSIPMLVTTM